MSVTVDLLYDSTLVGHITNVLRSDDTWYGVFRIADGLAQQGFGKRILEFIQFCEDWNEKTRLADTPPDAAEFDAYSDLLTSSAWLVRNEEGNLSRIVDAPVFFRGGEITWRES